MLAIVCDCCGKVTLLSDDEWYGRRSSGYHTLQSDTMKPSKLDLCEECAEKLVAAVRKE